VKKGKNKAQKALCPCDSGQAYAKCCEEFHQKRQAAPNAEALMRSRYSAYSLMLEQYIKDTWLPEYCPSTLSLDPQQRWIGLAIKACNKGRGDDYEGTVEFVARYKINGKAHRLHELSRFRKINGLWWYLDGIQK